ncbi:citrate:proton symporter [Lysinibacillus fusiformis]|nr:citrate:proton symporter [Lysinibacillus fusiformis]
MLSLIAYLMIIIFMVLVITKKLTAFNGLIVSSLVAGIAAALVNGQDLSIIFDWIKEGLFVSVDESGEVSLGTINSAIMILFAILYFSLMMNVGLFDPLCTFLIRKAKGDPLKILLVTVLTASVVTLDGDGTTTILIITGAFVPLYKRMGLKLSYLAMLIIMPTTIGNILPWGGPLARASAVINVEVNELFVTFLPVMLIGLVYCIFLGYFFGMKERKRLGYVAGKSEIVTKEQIEEMCNSITNTDKEFKRPKLFIFNLVLTLLMMYALIEGITSGAIIFLIGTAIALVVNYNEKDQKDRLVENAGDALYVSSIIIAAGAFIGIFTGSGMADAIATSLISIIPESMGGHLSIFFSFIGAVACYALPVDGYYFGILPVVVPIAEGFGITPTEITMSALMGQAIRYASPLVPWLFLLIDKTEMTFGDYQKLFFKCAIPLFFIFLISSLLLGLFPL